MNTKQQLEIFNSAFERRPMPDNRRPLPRHPDTESASSEGCYCNHTCPNWREGKVRYTATCKLYGGLLHAGKGFACYLTADECRALGRVS